MNLRRRNPVSNCQLEEQGSPIQAMQAEDEEDMDVHMDEEASDDEDEKRVKTEKKPSARSGDTFPRYGLLPMYRPLNDAVASIIINSKSEGASKFEIGKHIGYNVHTKGGSRKISAHIQQVCKLFPEHIDQFQKMTGKFRSIHYFQKNSTPENLIEMMARFERLVGGKCPFSFGQIIKFPGSGLNTLRISDVTFQRLLTILELLSERSVIVPSQKIVRHLQDKER